MDSHSIRLLFSAIHLLRAPAGDDPDFSSSALIQANWHEFVSRAHTSFDHVQMLSIAEIMRVESAIKACGGARDLKKELQYERLLWRRLGDTIAWLLVGGQRHVIKRMCGFQDRPFLANCNPDSAIGFIRDFNRDKLRFALWADTTNCIDAGDMLLRDVRRPGVTLAELKEGDANRKASAALACEQARRFFLAEYGDKGREQLVRMTRQSKKLEAITNLLNTDQGVDPFSDQTISLHDASTLDEDYGEILTHAIDAARVTGISVVSVDSCLWIAAVAQPSITANEIAVAIANAALTGPHAEQSIDWLRNFFKKTVPYPIHDIRESFIYHIAYPIYMANIPTENVVDILTGKMRVYLYFDWASFGRLAETLGIQFQWSSTKVGRRMKALPRSRRPLVLGDRVPTIVVGDAELMLGATQLVRVLFDLIRPEIMLRQNSEFDPNAA